MATISASRGHAVRWPYKAAIAGSVLPANTRSRKAMWLASRSETSEARSLAAASAARAASTSPQQDLRLAGVGQGKTGIGGDGFVVSLVCTGVERQRQIGGLNVGIPSGR